MSPTSKSPSETTALLNPAVQLAMNTPKLKGVVAHIGDAELTITAPDAAHSWVLATVAQHAPVLAITATTKEADDLTAELRAMMGEAVENFPAWETLPHEKLSPGRETMAARLRVLHRLPHTKVVVASARAVIQPLANQAVDPLVLREGAEVADIVERLTYFGYERVDLVGKRGECAIRGGIIDIFPATADLPVRLELWGDEISELRHFSIGDQRTLADHDPGEVTVYPCRELLCDEAMQQRAAQLATQHASQAQLADMLTRISEGAAPEGMEALIPLLHDGALVTLPELMPTNAHVVVIGAQKAQRRADDLITSAQEFLKAGWEAAALGSAAPIDVESGGYRSWESLHHSAGDRPWWTLSPPGFIADDTLELSYPPALAPKGRPDAVEEAMASLRDRVKQNHRIIFTALTPASAKRHAQLCGDYGIPASVATTAVEPAAGQVTIVHAPLQSGLDVAPDFSVITDPDFTGNRVASYSDGRKKPARKRNRVDPLALTAGDLVVHDTHGIGRFVAMEERTIGRGDEASRREFVVLEYAPSKRGGAADRLYVPTDSLDLLSRYVGGENPSLSKMGGSDWKQTKRKARAAVKDIAQELVQLYAKRQAASGFAFGPDTPWQREMEDNFPFTETEDQASAIDDVKADMERDTPMDRVVVGDVGYGKTEVAVRAAFKAVQAGKQVAVLVPTTLLCQQHVSTFTERMAGFPISIRELSRFTSGAESKEILAGMAKGEVDIVIGTHRLLQTGVQWKNLGLIVVDEEQRFGVEHKEHIKALRTNVDVLTMSATPIPRTLEMSMAGIRDMSTILTPPQERFPVLTYVGAADDKHIAAAIRRELLRDGQIFYVHNRVRTIEKTAAHLRELVPEARVVVAHGQMNEEQLERTVEGFWEREFDILVCTTIVETGLDISNANTLIVDNAHHMGLSQLHQLRGRVGRSRERGYAYFLYPGSETLSETSFDRLSTIAQNNDLGAGMAVAMKDLEMRGAGNVLGSQQSGHIAGVGFDLYMRLVGEAVQAFKAIADGEPVDAAESEKKETRIELPIDAHIPASYIDAERLRLAAYRQLAEAQDEDGLVAVRQELIDRFGPVPEEFERLLLVARLRLVCREFGVEEILAPGQSISFSPLKLEDSGRVRLARLYPGARYRATAETVVIPVPKHGRGLRATPYAADELVQWCSDVITSMAGVARRNLMAKI